MTEGVEEKKLIEGLKRFKVYVSGESEPLILMGKNEKDAKKTAYMMLQNSSVKVRKVVKEGKIKPKQKISKKEWGKIKKFNKHIGQDGTHYVMQLTNKGTALVPVVVEGKLTEDWTHGQAYSSKEAKKVMDSSLRDYAKDLRKLQGRVVKDWLSKAKSGVMDYFDISRGLTTGDMSRAHPYEMKFLHSVLLKDKIMDRFKSYFGGKKGKPRGK